MGDTDTTIDFIAVGIIAIVIGFIVYEVSQATQSVSTAVGGLGGVLLSAAAGAGVVLFFL